MKFRNAFLQFILCLFIFFSQMTYSQNYFGIKIATTIPLPTDSRNLGLESGLSYGIKIKENYFIETGFYLDAYWKTKNPIIQKQFIGFLDTVPRILVQDGSYVKFSANIPVLINYVANSKLKFNTGFLLSGRNILTITNYPGIDPEIGYSSCVTKNYYAHSRRFGIEWQLGTDYRILNSFFISLNYRTSLNEYFFNDGLIVLGFKYNFKE